MIIIINILKTNFYEVIKKKKNNFQILLLVCSGSCSFISFCSSMIARSPLECNIISGTELQGRCPSAWVWPSWLSESLVSIWACSITKWHLAIWTRLTCLNWFDIRLEPIVVIAQAKMSRIIFLCYSKL